MVSNQKRLKWKTNAFCKPAGSGIVWLQFNARVVLIMICARMCKMKDQVFDRKQSKTCVAVELQIHRGETVQCAPKTPLNHRVAFR